PALGNTLGAGSQGFDDSLKRRTLRTLDDFRSAPVNSRARELKLLGRFDVQHLTPNRREFRQIGESSKSRMDTEPTAVRLHFNRLGGVGEYLRPRIEMSQPQLLQRLELKIFHHHEAFGD